ncbi:hypothetical protein K443DRAFT_659546, partial [Laccaria amethystina LaAM-08-1]
LLTTHPPGQSQGAPPTSHHVGCVNLTTHTSLQTRRESAHPVPHQTRPPPLHQSPLTKIPTKPPENPQNHPSTHGNNPSTHGNNPVPRINHPCRRNRPTKIRNRWNPAPRPIDEDPAPLSKPTPTLQPGAYPPSP